jgi:hypothetical protein
MKDIKEPKDAVIRARCVSALKKDLEDVARLQGIDSADVLRIAAQNYVRKVREKMNGLAIAD